MTTMLEELASADDQSSPDAVEYVFRNRRQLRVVCATTLEYAWRALDISLGDMDDDDTDDWTLISIDGQQS